MHPAHQAARVRAFAGLASLLVGLSSAMSCIPEFEKIPREEILYEYQATLEPCSGNVAFFDRAVRFLVAQLGVSTPDKLRYTWIDHVEMSRYPVYDPPAGGWTVGSHAFADRPELIHEVVHLIAAQATVPFFREGLAVALDPLSASGIGLRYQAGQLSDPRATMDATTDALDLAHAAFFVTFLLVRHGADKFRTFYSRLSVGSSMSRIRAVFRAAYGLELDAEVEVYMQGSLPCDADSFPLQLTDCSAPTQDWRGQEWSFETTLACESPNFVGGLGPDRSWWGYEQITLDVAESGNYVLAAVGDPGTNILFGPCFGCPWEFRDILMEHGDVRDLSLPAGKYYLRISAKSDRTTASRVSLTHAPSP